MQSCDIIINGGGIIGLALAYGLKKSGLNVIVIDRQPLKHIHLTNFITKQISVISNSSKLLLEYINIWEAIISQYINSHYSIKVWEKDSFGQIFFDINKLKYQQFGYIIENDAIQKALWSKLDEIVIISPAIPKKVIWGKDKVFIILKNNKIIQANLLVAADGVYSWLRQEANIPIAFWDNRRCALITNVRTEQPHNNIALQIFYNDSILVFLPLTDPYVSHVIWSLPSDVAQYRLIQPIKTFNDDLTINYGLTLGLCSLVSNRQIFPINHFYARNFASHRLVLLGDAAHTIYPLISQKINFGLMDVAVLLKEINHLQKYGKDIGLYSNLQNYERKQKNNTLIMLAELQTMQWLFNSQYPIKKLIRNTSLCLIDIIPSIKSIVLEKAIGTSFLSNWFN